jgi:hypothetical protein
MMQVEVSKYSENPVFSWMKCDLIDCLCLVETSTYCYVADLAGFNLNQIITQRVRFGLLMGAQITSKQVIIAGSLALEHSPPLRSWYTERLNWMLEAYSSAGDRLFGLLLDNDCPAIGYGGQEQVEYEYKSGKLVTLPPFMRPNGP